MAKKRFTDDLDNLFDAPQEQSEQSLSLFPKPSSETTKQKNSKGFAAKLDAFLAEAFESADAQEKQEKQEAKAVKKTTRKPRRLTGLDLLIRQTTTDTPPTKRLNLADKRRLTLAFDKAQLAQLKEIAEKEGVFLKDLINQLIERYLQERDN